MHKTAFSRYTNPINIWEMKSMFDFIKAVRETAAAARRIRPELIHLKFEIDRTKCAIDAARNHFEQAVDPTLIDCYIYELNAAQLRYQFLLRKFKSQED